jgi:hypothetical protein
MGLSPMPLSLSSRPSHILVVVLFKRSAGGASDACGVVYLTPAMVLLLVLVGASGGTMLVWPDNAEVGGILEIGKNSGVQSVMEVL